MGGSGAESDEQDNLGRKPIMVDNADGGPKKVSPSVKLMQKRKQVFEVQEALLRQKEIFNEKEEKFRAMEEVVKRRDEEFRKRLMDHVSWAEETEQKIGETERLLSIEKKLKSSREGELKKGLQKLQFLNEQKSSILDAIEQARVFEEILKGDSQTLREFDDVQIVLHWYSMLLRATLAAGPSTASPLPPEHHTFSVLEKSGIAEEKCSSDPSHVTNNVTWLARKEHIEQEFKGSISPATDPVPREEVQNFVAVRMAIGDMYKMTMLRTKAKEEPVKDPINQLLYVCSFISDFQKRSGANHSRQDVHDPQPVSKCS